MNTRTIELFKQAGEEAYKLCKEHDHKVGEVDSIWVSIMAANLTELVIKECAELFPKQNMYGGNAIHNMIKEHFGIEE